jgi:hypothetical protein
MGSNEGAKTDDQRPDLVGDYLSPMVRPLGNVFILYANAEAALRDFLAQVLLWQGKAKRPEEAEEEAHRIVSGKDWRAKVAPLLDECEVDQCCIKDLHKAVEDYGNARDERNRLAHDEWHLAIDVDNPEASVGAIRGRKPKQPQPMYDAPTVDKLWELAARFNEVRAIFDSAAYNVKRRSQEGSI